MKANERVYRNTKALTKIAGKDMKDVEAEIGRTAGYLSRKNSKIGVDELMKISSVFGVTADELLTVDFEYELKRKEAIEKAQDVIRLAREFMSDNAITALVDKVLQESEEQP